MKVGRDPALLFDLRATQPRSSDAHGAAEYAKAVLSALLQTGRTDIVGVFDESMAVQQSLLQRVAAHGWRLQGVKGVNGLQQLIDELAPRRFFSALPYEYGSISFKNCELIATIHGLRPIEMPADAYASRFASTSAEWLKSWLRYIGRDAYVARRVAAFESLLAVKARRKVFVVPSEFTKRSILARLQHANDFELNVLYSPKTDLAASALAGEFSPATLQLETRKYVLLVSGDRWIKNTYRALVAAESLLGPSGVLSDTPLVVVGSVPKGFPRRWQRQFRILGRCDTKTLAGLYANAGLLLYPTLNEGFGYPPIEAMSYGTPVLCSGISAVPEIAADGAAYFSPFDPVEIAIRLEYFLADPVARSDLAAAGSRRYLQIEQRQTRDLHRLCSLLLDE